MFRLFCQQTTISRGLSSGLTTRLLLLLDLLVCKDGIGVGFGVISMEESCEQRRRKNTNTLQARSTDTIALKSNCTRKPTQQMNLASPYLSVFHRWQFVATKFNHKNVDRMQIAWRAHHSRLIVCWLFTTCGDCTVTRKLPFLHTGVSEWKHPRLFLPPSG